MPAVLVIISCFAGEARGQTAWQYTGTGVQCEPTGYAYWHGRVGIRTQSPAVPLHIHSGACLDGLTYYPAIARFQTQAADYTFGKSEIQFWSGAQGIQDWYVSAIKPMTMAAPPFNTSDALAPLEYLGGLAFFCSGTGQRPLGNEIEVMRLYDRRVAINTGRAVGRFDVGTSPTNADGWRSRIVFDDKPDGSSGASGPVIRMFRPDGTNLVDKEFGAAITWWLQCSNDAYGSLKFRSGNTAAGGNAPNVDAEIPNTRMTLRSNGMVGVNTEWPISKFQVHNGAVLFDGTEGITPQNEDWSQLGAGTRLMWIPEKAAFRAGKLNDEIADYDEVYAPSYIAAEDFWNAGEIGSNSVAMGLSCKAKGTASTAIGWMNTCVPGTSDGHGAVALGHYNFVDGNDAVALGFDNKARAIAAFAAGEKNRALGDWSRALGYYSTASGKQSTVIGTYITASAEDAVTIGTGISNASRLNNNVQKSIMIGFNSDKPTLFVSGGTGSSGTFGNVGIGTISPNTTLGVNGNVSIGWSGTQGMPTIPSSGNPGADANPVSLLVEKTVIIGGTDYVHRTQPTVDYGASNGASMLQVWGNAIKYQSGGNSAWDIPSDSRYKKDVSPYRDGLVLLKRINPVRFRYSEKLGLTDSSEGIGVLAQEIQEILPYTVREDSLRHIVKIKEERRYEIDAIDTIITHSSDGSLKDGDGHPKLKDTTIYSHVKKWVVEPAEFATESSPLLIYNPSALTYTIINSVKEIDSMRIAETAALQEKVALLESATAALAAADSLQRIAIGALQEINDALAAKHEALLLRNDSLLLVIKNHEERIARLEAKNEIPLDEAADVILEQNNPNPFAESTIITYYIPDRVQGEAELIVSPASQTPVLQRYPLTKGIPAQLSVSASDLYTGVFVYSIIANGKVLATKKFIVIK